MAYKTIKTVEPFNVSKKTIEQILENHKSIVSKSPQCLHTKCKDCNGTGTKKNGQLCVHMVSCPCSTCSPFSL